MILLWIRWSGGIETRDDGYTIFHNVPGFEILRHPNGYLTKHRALNNEAKKVADECARIERQDHSPD